MKVGHKLYIYMYIIEHLVNFMYLVMRVTIRTKFCV